MIKRKIYFTIASLFPSVFFVVQPQMFPLSIIVTLLPLIELTINWNDISRISSRRIGRKTIRAFDYGEVVRLFFRRRIGRKPTAVRALALARDDGHGLCRNAVALCNIVYEKDPAKGDIGQARAPADAAAATPSVADSSVLRKWFDRGYETVLIT